MINWQYFPKSDAPTLLVRQVVAAFESVACDIDSSLHDHPSNGVLDRAAEALQSIGFTVETGKLSEQKVHVPVLFGREGTVEKAFEADAFHAADGFVLEVEAGRGVVNNQFLKDFFQACMMHDVVYLGIAVRNQYRGNRDFERVVAFFETLYASRRLALPLKGILVLGY
jgi:hypothetical protein